MALIRGVLAVAGIGMLVPAPAAPAAEWAPIRPVRLIVGFPPGGATDLVARVIQPKLSEALGRQVVVDNRPGANGTISLDMVARAEPDGRTVAFGHIGGLVISAAIQKLPYDPLKSFTPIGLMVTLQNIIITHPGVAAKNLDEFVALARTKPGRLNYASAGVGSPGHLAAELLEAMTGVRMNHIPYKGGGPAITDLLAGHVPSFFAVISTVVPHVQSGKVRGIAVTGGKRSPALPAVPTIGETVKGYVATNWYGLLAPAGVPGAVVERLSRDLVSVLRQPEIAGQLAARGIESTPTSPADYAAFIQSETGKWAPVIRRANIGN
ncbi:MAG: tripartite tricarboxylate transporter substrate binding protein [Burkholderiales bacterium]|nr:tripartite tricarboxylate transporter substrate binding protein [Burkholderiales bacterium]